MGLSQSTGIDKSNLTDISNASIYQADYIKNIRHAKKKPESKNISNSTNTSNTNNKSSNDNIVKFVKINYDELKKSGLFDTQIDSQVTAKNGSINKQQKYQSNSKINSSLVTNNIEPAIQKDKTILILDNDYKIKEMMNENDFNNQYIIIKKYTKKIINN